ncbi:MAG: NFACT family protein [candidate division Zixibacteria bacterium]|nr:NFACT family protein [candidate division Zixibacteria bacterium]
MQTALHIAALVAELKKTCAGGTIVSSEYYKKERAAYFFIRKDKTLSALGFVFHPSGSGYFCVPASKIKIETTEKPWPIFGLNDAVIQSIDQHGLDRIFEFKCLVQGKTCTVVFEAIGPNGNIWFLDESGGRQATLRNKTFEPGEKYQSVIMQSKLNPFDITPHSLREKMAEEEFPSLVTAIEKRVTGFNRTISKEAVKRAGLDFVELSVLTDIMFETLCGKMKEMAERFLAMETGYLYSIKSSFEAYPFKLTTVETDPEKFKSISLAVLEMFGRKQAAIDEEDSSERVHNSIEKGIDKLKKRIVHIERDIREAGKFEQYKKLGELLQINHTTIKRGMTEIIVADILSEDQRKISIPLDPALSASGNTEAYFKKHRKGREGLELLERRLEVTRQELAELETVQSSVRNDYENATARYQTELASLLPIVGEKQESLQRLPYRPHTLSTGVTIFIGRDGADNDRTTFEFARPYELWFHAQQCPGSHVILKFPNKSFTPSRREIEETAAIAAFHSRAKNDRLVPVIYTERKYVRKPRKAKPGLVSVEREKSVMVEPKKPE